MTDHTAGSVPRIRFKGFDAAWEPKKLGQIYTERNERGNDSLPILSVSIHSGISNGELSTETLGKKVRRSEDKSLYKHVHSGDLVLNMMRAWQGALGVTKIEGMVSPAYLTATPDETIYPLFMDCGLRRPHVVAQMNKLSYGVTDFRKRLYWDSFVRVKFAAPSVSEQQRIASYFSHLDSVISLHQRKHEKLAVLKRAMLQQMFPKPGATVPEVRFKEFSADWLPKKIGDIIDLNSGRDYKHLSPGNVPVYGTGGYMLSVNEALSVAMDAIGIGRKGTIDKPYILRAPFWTIDTLFYATPKARSDLNFVYCIFQRIDWKQKDESTGAPSLSKEAINGVDVLITNPAEQEKIGAYFHSLDSLMDSHATEIHKLQQIKSAFLKEMFA
jgi:type I restriction enzyme S subunit